MRAHQSSIPYLVNVVSWLSASVYNAEMGEGEDEQEETEITRERGGTAVRLYNLLLRQSESNLIGENVC